jgi:hypothetical protein
LIGSTITLVIKAEPQPVGKKLPFQNIGIAMVTKNCRPAWRWQLFVTNIRMAQAPLTSILVFFAPFSILITVA